MRDGAQDFALNHTWPEITPLYISSPREQRRADAHDTSVLDSHQSLPTWMIWKEWGIIGARGPRAHAGGPPAAGGAAGDAVCGEAAGTGPNSAVIRKMWPVLLSRVRVLARAGVGTVCSTWKLVGESSLITVSVPSPCELKASIVAGLKVAPSHPLPMG